MKTMILAALAALSLGMSVANATMTNQSSTERNYGQYGMEGGGG
jgi:hypothetical protein